jgi:APA family basic amino acid/polyamine antiporter
MDGLFPPVFGRRTARGVPVWALTITSALTTVLVALNYTRGLVAGFTFFILLATLATLVPYVFCSMTLVLQLLRTKASGPDRGLVGGIVLGSAALAYSLWAITSTGWETVFWGFALLTGGVPAYVWLVRRVERRGANDRTAP